MRNSDSHKGISLSQSVANSWKWMKSRDQGSRDQADVQCPRAISRVRVSFEEEESEKR
jgi:hypothetical protein